MPEDESYLNKRGLSHFWDNIDTLKQDKLTAGANITIAADNTISASQPTVNNATLTIQKEGTSVGTFTANASSNSTVNIIETDPTVPAWAKASSKPTYTWTEITNRPTNVSAFTNDAGYLTNTNYASASTGGVVKVGSGLAISSGGVLSATGGGTADDVAWGHITGTMADQTDLTTALAAKANSADLATVATSGDYDDLTDKPTIGTGLLTLKNNNVVIGTFSANSTSARTITVTTPTKTSDLTNDSGFLTSYTETDPIYSASPAAGITATDISSWNAKSDFSGSYNDLTDKPTIGNATLTIQKNGTSAGTFTANATSNKSINITVPTTAADVSALPSSTKYGASITVTIDPSDYKITTTLKDQDGNRLGAAQTIDLPLESVVVNGSYDSTNKKIVLTLQSGSTIDIPVGDLVAGLQSEITSTNKLASDLVDDTGQTHKFMTSAEKTKLSGIAAGAEVNVQSDWNQTTTTADDYIKNKPTLATVATSGSYNDLSNKPTIPTVNNAKLTIQKNGTTVKTFTANASSNVTANITVPTKTSDLTNDSGFLDSVAWGDVTGKPTFATVATSGSYNDLSNKPTIPAAQVQSNWTQTMTTAVDYIKNKPTLATVATSGSYNDLSNKPTIPTVNNATLTIQKNGTTVKTFTANASSNVTANITVPTKTSDLTNDSGFLDSVAWGDVTGKPTFATVATSGSYNDLTNKPTIPTVNNATLTIQKNGTTVKTFTANASSNVTANITVPTKTSDLTNDSGFVNSTAIAGKQDLLTAGAHINITGTTIKATDYVHSEQPVPTSSVTPVVTGNMISNGTITADKLATGATLKLTLSTSDIGEGAALAANTLYGVYQ